MLEPKAGLREVGAAFAGDVDRVVERAGARVRAEVGDFPADLVSDYELWVADAAARIAAALAVGRAPGIEDGTTDNEWIARCARGGVALQTVHAAMQIYIEEARAQFLDQSERLGLPPSEAMNVVTRGWEAWDIALSQAAALHRRALALPESADARRRYEFVEMLMRDRGTRAEREHAALRLGLDPTSTFIAFRLRPRHPDRAIQQYEQRLRAELALTRPSSVITTRGSELAGLLPEAPSDVSGDCYCGLGNRASFAALTESFDEALLALETASRFDLPGAHTVESLGLQAFVVATARHASSIRARYLDPVLQLPQGQTLLDTVETYLAADRDVTVTAATLHLHRNSLRKRIQRYEELTGTDLRKVEDVVGTWWALRLRTLE